MKQLVRTLFNTKLFVRLLVALGMVAIPLAFITTTGLMQQKQNAATVVVSGSTQETNKSQQKVNKQRKTVYTQEGGTPRAIPDEANRDAGRLSKPSVAGIMAIAPSFKLSPSAVTATKTWNGAGVTGGTGGTDFNAAANWLPATALTTTDDLVMNVSPATSVVVTTSATVTVNSLAVTMSGNLGATAVVFNLQIPNQTLTINGATTATNTTTGGGAHQLQFTVGNGAGTNALFVMKGAADFGSGSTNTVFLRGVNSSASNVFRFEGNTTMGAQAATSATNFPSKVVFNATAAQTVTINSTGIGWPSVDIGVSGGNSPTVTFAGTSNAVIDNQNSPTTTNLTIIGTSTLDLTTHTLNSNTTAFTCTFTLNAGTTIKLGGTTGGITGSNFPLNFTTYTLSATGTEVYNATGAQTINLIGGKGNLTCSNPTTITFGGAITTAGTLSVTVGSVNVGAFTLTTNGATTITAGALLSVPSGGIMKNAGTVTSTALTLSFSSGAKYQHNFTTTAGTIPTATWSTGSTVEVIGYTTNSSATGGLVGQTFSNFTWNCASQTGNPNQGGNLPTINGNLTVSAGTFRLAGNNNYTLTIGGDLIITGGTLDLTNGGSSGNTQVVNIGGNFNQTGGTFTATSAGQRPLVVFTGGASSSVTFTQSAGTFTITVINWQIASPKTLTFNNAFTLATGRTMTVDSGATLATGVGITNNGTLAVNGTLQINSGGFITGTAPTYGSSSFLVYNTPSGFGVGTEWTGNSTTAGLGVPQNVTIQSGPGGTVTMPNSTRGMAGNLNISTGTLALNATSGDLKVGGNWTRTSTASFTPNNRAVFFNGTGTQTLTVNPAGTETFNYLIVDKTAGTLKFNNSPATQVNVNATAGDVLQLINAGGIDLAGNTLTLQNNGGNILVTGGVRTISDPSNFAGAVSFTGSKSVVSTGGGTLSITNNVVVRLSAAVDFGAGLTTVNNRFIINSGGSVNTNPVTYTVNSTLVYNTGGTYGRGAEWSQTTSPGYPDDVQISSNTTLNLGNGGAGTARQMSGTLTIDSGSTLSMAVTPMTAALTVLGDVVNQGTLTLSTAPGGDLKTQGNFTNNGTFTPNDRAVFFEGGNTQTVNASAGTLTIPYLRINKSGGTVQLGNTDVTTLGPNGGDSIQFTGATSTLTLNGRTLNLGGTISSTPAGAGFIGSNTSSMSLQNGGTPGAMGTLRFVSGAENLQNLTLNRTGALGSVTLGTVLTINGGTNALTLTAGILNTGAFTLKMGDNASSNGSSASYVVGTMNKLYTTVPKNFTFDLGTIGGPTPGYTPASVNAQLTSSPGDVTATVTNAHHPSLSGSSLERYWSLQNDGLTLANLEFNYLDGDLPASPPEAALVTYKIDGPTATTPPGSAVNPATNQITMSAATSFSDWTAGAIDAPTAVKMVSFNATSDRDGVLVRWQTGREVENLGFILYREDGRGRVRVTPSLVAGSALLAGPRTTLTAGQSYSWWDAAGQPDSRYYLEDVDLKGQRKLHGPVSPSMGRISRSGALDNRATLLSELRPLKGAATVAAEQGRPASMNKQPGSIAGVVKEIDPESDPLIPQRIIAAGQAVKLQVRQNGWYRVSGSTLAAAGLDPRTPHDNLHLYADGVEVPIRVRAADRGLGLGGAIEFYGTALDTPGSDTRTYWLVVEDRPGKRIDGEAGNRSEGGGLSPVGRFSRVDGNIIGGLQSFAYTVERKDRVVYFAALHNGDAENFFGPIISTTAATQTLNVNQLQTGTRARATLEVALQGGTSGEHQVRVKLNGTDLGLVTLNGQEHTVAQFSVMQSSLLEGQNTITLTAENGETDVSVVDYVRLTYARRYIADNNLLTFSMNGSTVVTVGGFTTPQISVLDITDPNDVKAVEGKVVPQGTGYSVTVQGASGPQRTLIALTNDRAAEVAGVSANALSTLTGDGHAGADFVILTNGAFKDAVEPLAQLRRNQGLTVAVIDIEDVYDEFSYGAHSTVAVRDFLSWTTTHWQTSPRYLLLVGDASLDPRNYLGYGQLDFVPTRTIDTGFLETASDDSLADFDNDGLAEMAIGRLPVRTVQQAETVVGKITGYVPGVSAQGALLIADHNDGYDFEGVNSQVQSHLPAQMPVTIINRGDNPTEQVRAQIIGGINDGPQVVNYVGHGSVEVWTGAGLLSSGDAANFTNGQRLPLFVSMTCLNGYFHDLYTESLAEALIKAPNGGAVAAWASSGLTPPGSQSAMDQQLIQLLFGGADSPMLGDAIKAAKSATNDRDVRRTWILFGDPTMRLR